MRIGTVIGRVTLSARTPSYRGERLLLTLPWETQTLRSGRGHAPSIVVYDELGAGVGQSIAISEGREAACPFEQSTPVDAYCAALIDRIFHNDEETAP